MARLGACPTRATSPQAPNLAALRIVGKLDHTAGPWDGLARLTGLRALRLLDQSDPGGAPGDVGAHPSVFRTEWLPPGLESLNVTLSHTRVVQAAGGPFQGRLEVRVGLDEHVRMRLLK
jgi:hypothetical protein